MELQLLSLLHVLQTIVCLTILTDVLLLVIAAQQYISKGTVKIQ